VFHAIHIREVTRIAMTGQETPIWEQLRVSPSDLVGAWRKDPVMDEICSDYEQVSDTMWRAERQSEAAGERHTPDLDLVRLKRELEQEVRARLLSGRN
jgi:hypothetical protein